MISSRVVRHRVSKSDLGRQLFLEGALWAEILYYWFRLYLYRKPIPEREIFCSSLGYVSCTLRPQADNAGLDTSLREKLIATVLSRNIYSSFLQLHDSLCRDLFLVTTPPHGARTTIQLYSRVIRRKACVRKVYVHLSIPPELIKYTGYARATPVAKPLWRLAGVVCAVEQSPKIYQNSCFPSALNTS